MKRTVLLWIALLATAVGATAQTATSSTNAKADAPITQANNAANAQASSAVPASSDVKIDVVTVSPSIRFLQVKSEDADITVYEGADSLVVIDTALRPIAPALRDAIRKFSSKPIRYVVLTHYHFDHIGGAEQFAREAPIVAQKNIRRRMMQPSKVGGRNDLPAPAAALPTITFDRQLSLFMPGEEIRLIPVRAHTDGDTIVWFTRANIVHMGDSILGVDPHGGGDIQGIIAACEKVVAMVPADAKVIVGHIGVVTVDYLKKQGRGWKNATAIIEKAIAEGKSLAQIKGEKLLAPMYPRNPDRVTEMIYVSLRQQTKAD